MRIEASSESSSLFDLKTLPIVMEDQETFAMESYIVVGYEEDQGDREITYEEVVRATNTNWFRPGELDDVGVKSRARCPTYGNCEKCMSSGPTSMRCQHCTEGFYTVLRMTDPGGLILDAQGTAQLCGMDQFHVVARANQRVVRTRMGLAQLADLQGRVNERRIDGDLSGAEVSAHEAARIIRTCEDLFDEIFMKARIAQLDVQMAEGRQRGAEILRRYNAVHGPGAAQERFNLSDSDHEEER